MNRNHRISVIPVLLVLLAAHVAAQTGTGRQAKPPARGPAVATSGPLDARGLCAIAAKNKFTDPLANGAPKWQAEEAACYGDRVLAADVRIAHFMVRGAKASDEDLRNTVQLYFTAAEGSMVSGDDLKLVAIPLIRSVLMAAGENVPDKLLSDVESVVQGRMGTERVPVETVSNRGFYKITMFFPGRTIE